MTQILRFFYLMTPVNLAFVIAIAIAATITSIPVECLMMAYVMSEGEQVLTGTWMDRDALMIVQPNWQTLSTESQDEEIVTTTITSVTFAQSTNTDIFNQHT